MANCLVDAQAIAYFAADTNRLALGLVRLKQIFPTADVASMVVKQPALLLEATPEQLATAAEQLRQLLPRFDIDWYARSAGTAAPAQHVSVQNVQRVPCKLHPRMACW